ncbi:putative toxin-antitoxin system toxin component, PIN family [Terracidiphilus sp.]|jgi:putative PIN family toxin of toxin-antitoxin system|uniref:putative toxin-antitoxin system toxin component, PIN family n=1 Tax=Terracidiphilus sp. TaxID=1964191 RepID=UPI003C1436C4
MRVVADTNILISALMFGGLPGAFLDLALTQAFTLVTSPALLDELDEKLRLKFGITGMDADLIRAKLEKSAQVIVPRIALAIVADDPDDDRVLECALAGQANCIVSGDRHLLRLGAYDGIEIMNVRAFVDALDIGF